MRRAIWGMRVRLCDGIRHGTGTTTPQLLSTALPIHTKFRCLTKATQFVVVITLPLFANLRRTRSPRMPKLVRLGQFRHGRIDRPDSPIFDTIAFQAFPPTRPPTD